MTKQTEREVLEALFKQCFPGSAFTGDCETCDMEEQRRIRFTAMLDAGAYLDAAMMMVPEGSEFGLNWSRMSVDMGGNNWRCHVGKHRASGRTPALALCAAIRAARDAQ